MCEGWSATCRRYSVSLVFFVGILFPLSTHAQALSPWVEEALRRIDTGVATAGSFSPPGSCTDDVSISEAENNLSMAREKFSVSLHMADESQFLRERTLCFQSDRILLEQKLRFLLGRLERAFTECNSKSAYVLRETYDFADAAYRSFLFGSVDPAYQDGLLRQKYAFDSMELAQTQQQPQEDPNSTAPLCPYTTDYAPHAIGYTPTMYGGGTTASLDIKSYGCDVSVLQGLPGPLQDEARPLIAFMNESDTFARETYETVSRALSTIDSIVAVVTGKAPPETLSGTVLPPPHEEKTGCLRPLSPEGDEDIDPKEIEYTLLAYPDYFSPDNLREQEIAPGTIIKTYGPTPELTLPTWLLFRPRHDFFQTFPNPFITLRSYADTREAAGANRPLPLWLSSSFVDTFFGFFRDRIVTTVLRSMGATLDREAAIIDAASRDAIELSASAAAPLRNAVKSLVHVTEEYLPNDYIPSLTFFLLRYCVDGHCQETLEAVTKRSFNPYCHPYVSGKYIEIDAAQRCFCDKSIEGTWDEWDTYCSEDISGLMSSYEALPADPVPACVPFDAVSSSSSR